MGQVDGTGTPLVVGMLGWSPLLALRRIPAHLAVFQVSPLPEVLYVAWVLVLFVVFVRCGYPEGTGARLGGRR